MKSLRASLVIVLAIATSVSCWAQDRETFLDDIPLAPCRLTKIELKGGFTDPGVDNYDDVVAILHRPPRIDEISLLNKKWVQDELALTPTETGHFRDEHKRLIENRAPVPSNLTKSLDSKKVEKLLDIRIRCRIRAMGIVEFFNLPQLELSNDELKAVRNLVEELEPIYAKRAADLRDKTLQKIRDVLTKEQQEQIDELSSGFLESRLPSLDLLIWQLRNIDCFEETIADRTMPEFRGLVMSTIFCVDYDGTIEEDKRLFSGATDNFKKKLSDREQKVKEDLASESFFTSLNLIFTDQSMSAELQFTDEQVQAADNVRRKLGSFESEWHETIFRIRRAGEQDRSEIYAKFERLKADLVAEGIRDLETIMLPHQRKILETMSILLEGLKGGFPGALVSGQTGKTLRLTANQKSEIVQICEKSLSEIESQTRRWEQEIFARLKDTFGDKRKQDLTFLFRSPISHGTVNIYLLLKGGL